MERKHLKDLYPFNGEEEKENKFLNLLDNNNFDLFQKEIIYTGIIADLNVEIYAKPEFSYLQMIIIKTALLENKDYSKYIRPNLTKDEIEKFYLEL